jgi:hypothetical protein
MMSTAMCRKQLTGLKGLSRGHIAVRKSRNLFFKSLKPCRARSEAIKRFHTPIDPTLSHMRKRMPLLASTVECASVLGVIR